MIQSFRPSAENGFSEFMVQQGNVSSFHRLFLHPFARVMYSSRASEHMAVKARVAEGMREEDAIRAVAKTLYGEELAAIERVE